MALTFPLAGCFLPQDRPEPALDVPKNYLAGPRSVAVAEAALPSSDWWRGFGSSELSGLVEQARSSNLDIAMAVARILQADAQSRITGAALLPSVGLNGSATRFRPSQTTAGGSGEMNGPSEFNNLLASLTASYEIDFWGKNRAALRAAEETAVASRFEREVVELSTVVATANAYLQLLTAQDRLRVARDNLQSAERVLGVVQERVGAGTASQLDLAQQESVVSTQRAAIPPLEQTVAQNRNVLALLIARAPERVFVRGGSLIGIRYPRVTPGIPSELLARRPDIRQAEANLASANANVANARAQMLPSITLTGEGGYQSAVLKTLLRPESAFYTLAAGLTQPIFDGLRLQGNLDLQKAKQDELLQAYRKAVISAFTDVETALQAIRNTSARERLQGAVVTSSRRAFEISEQRFREGTVDLVTVLQTQQALFQAQDTLVQARLERLQAILGLYQALGGGWSPRPGSFGGGGERR